MIERIPESHRRFVSTRRRPPPGELQLGWSRLETGPRYQQNCTECHKEKARPIRSEPQESQAAPWRLQSIASGPRGIPSTKRSPPNSGACHVQDSADDEERAKSHQEHSRLLFVAAPHNTTGVKHPGSKTFRPSAAIQPSSPDEPTGRANARPMTGSAISGMLEESRTSLPVIASAAKQSIGLTGDRWIASSLRSSQ